VSDRAFDPHGLYPVDWDLLTRIPGLTSLDMVTTDTRLAGAPHERMHAVLPGIREVRADQREIAPELNAVLLLQLADDLPDVVQRRRHRWSAAP